MRMAGRRPLSDRLGVALRVGVQSLRKATEHTAVGAADDRCGRHDEWDLRVGEAALGDLRAGGGRTMHCEAGACRPDARAVMTASMPTASARKVLVRSQ